MPSSSVGPYEIIAEIGRGGSATVYRGKDLRNGAEVALKVFDRVGRRHFSGPHEEDLLSRLSHPGIPRLLEVGGGSGESHWLAMEFLVGRPLSALNAQLWGPNDARPSTTTSFHELSATPAPPMVALPRRQGPLPPIASGNLSEVLRIYRSLGDIVRYVHDRGIVHRDLKPSNVLLTASGPAILDFGLAAPSGTVPVIVGGSPAYVAPEQIARREADTRSDLYSLGCMLFETLTGRTPFIGTDTRALLESHVLLAPLRVVDLVEAVPETIDDLVAGLLAKRVEERTSSIVELQRILDNCLTPEANP